MARSGVAAACVTLVNTCGLSAVLNGRIEYSYTWPYRAPWMDRMEKSILEIH